MVIKMFSLFDVKAESYGTPFFMSAVGLAVRAFIDLVNDNKSTVNRYPGDFILFQLGEFDDNTGVLVMEKAPISLGNGASFINKPAAPAIVKNGLEPVLVGGK